MIRRYAPDPARQTELHRRLATLCGISAGAAMLLVELDVFGEVRISDDEHLDALAELKARGLADLSETPHSCVHAVPSVYVREVLTRARSILALEGELARRTRPESAARASEPKRRVRADGPLSAEQEQAIIKDALAVVEASSHLPAARKARIYLRTGPRFVRVFWTYSRPTGDDDRNGSILHFVERATGTIYLAKSARQVGGPTGRVLFGFRGAADA